MTDYPNPDPHPEDRQETGQPAEPHRGPNPIPADGREEDAVQIYERQEDDERTGANLVSILIGLVLLIFLGYLAYQFLF